MSPSENTQQPLTSLPAVARKRRRAAHRREAAHRRPTGGPQAGGCPRQHHSEKSARGASPLHVKGSCHQHLLLQRSAHNPRGQRSDNGCPRREAWWLTMANSLGMLKLSIVPCTTVGEREVGRARPSAGHRQLKRLARQRPSLPGKLLHQSWAETPSQASHRQAGSGLTQARSSHVGAGAHRLDPSSTAFPHTIPGNWTESGSSDPWTWVVLHCLPTHHTRESDRKWNSWDWNWYQNGMLPPQTAVLHFKRFIF